MARRRTHRGAQGGGRLPRYPAHAYSAADGLLRRSLVPLLRWCSKSTRGGASAPTGSRWELHVPRSPWSSEAPRGRSYHGAVLGPHIARDVCPRDCAMFGFAPRWTGLQAARLVLRSVKIAWSVSGSSFARSFVQRSGFLNVRDTLASAFRCSTPASAGAKRPKTRSTG